MQKFLAFFTFVIMMTGVFSQTASARDPHERTNHLYQKQNEDADNAIVFAKLAFPPNEDGCNLSDLDGLVTFDIRIFEKIYGTSFDVDKIYIDSTGNGNQLLKDWIEDWNQGGKLPAIGATQSIKKDWSKGIIRICMGTGVLANAGVTVNKQVRSIFVWYDQIATPFNFPPDRPKGTPMNMRDYADALAVSDNGNRLRDLNGAGINTEATEPPDNDHPDFIVDKVWLTTTGGTEQYTYNINEQIKMNGRLKNIGDDDIPGSEHVKSRFYLSRGYKEDAHSEWVRVGVGETLGSNLDEGESHSEQEGLNLWEYSEIKPGKTYNIVVCADRTADSGNGDGEWQEEHESNNCSTEAVFTVNGAFNFNVTSVTLSTGSATLTPGQAFDITTLAYNAGIDSPLDTRVGYYFSGGSITGDLLIGTSQIKEENFEASTSKTEGLTAVVAPMDAGTYTLKVCTDYDDRVVETNETDNCTTASFTVAVPSTPNPAPKKTTPGVTGVLFGS